jgi:uncharacterized membrane protein YqjE
MRLDALPRLAPAVLRHLLAYADLLCEETGDALRQLRRRAIGLVVTVVAGAMALMLGCLWIIAANWDGPHRLMAVGALCVGFLIAGVIAWIMSQPQVIPGKPQPFERLRAEWTEDSKLLAAELERSAPTEDVPRVGHGD